MCAQRCETEVGYRPWPTGPARLPRPAGPARPGTGCSPGRCPHRALAQLHGIPLVSRHCADSSHVIHHHTISSLRQIGRASPPENRSLTTDSYFRAPQVPAAPDRALGPPCRRTAVGRSSDSCRRVVPERGARPRLGPSCGGRPLRRSVLTSRSSAARGRAVMTRMISQTAPERPPIIRRPAPPATLRAASHHLARISSEPLRPALLHRPTPPRPRPPRHFRAAAPGAVRLA